MRINTTTRVLHYAMLFCVLYQLISSEFMMVLEPGKVTSFATFLFTMHMMVFGWGAFLIGSVYVVLLYDNTEGWGRMFPWFSARRRAAFFKEARHDVTSTFRGCFPSPEQQTALSGAVHGAGILLILAQGFTGAYVMLGVRSDGTMRSDTLLLLDLHALFGVLTWIFVVGHLVMFFSHLMAGHRSIMDIFKGVQIPWK